MLSIRVHLCLSLEVLLGRAAVFEPANAHPWARPLVGPVPPYTAPTASHQGVTGVGTQE
jgi:hypothetical protein